MCPCSPGQTGWGLDQPGLSGSVPDMAGGLESDNLPTQATLLFYKKLQNIAFQVF